MFKWRVESDTVLFELTSFLYFWPITRIDRGSGLLVRENPEDLRPKYRPSIWSQYRPVDITMTDLVFDDDWRKWEFWHKGQQIEESAMLAARSELAWNRFKHSESPILNVDRHHSSQRCVLPVQEVTQPYNDRYDRYTRPAAAGLMQWPNPPRSALTLRQ